MLQKQKHIPNISMPYTEVIKKLQDENMEYKLITIDPIYLKPLNKVINGNKISKFDNNDDPIYITEDLNIIDGHYRVANALSNNKMIKAVRILDTLENALRVLNKIQDIFDYEKQRNLEEVAAQDYINDFNDQDSGIKNDDNEVADGINGNYNFISLLEKDLYNNENADNLKNKQKLIGYRKSPINEKSNIGNFFLLNPNDEYNNKFEIEFENLLDLSNWELNDDNQNNPIEILSLLWFPNIDFNVLSVQYGVPTINLINKAITEKAKMMNYDGIRYNDKILHALK